MPSARVAIGAVLFDESGWKRVNANASDCQILGIDRHGQPAFRRVEVHDHAETVRVAFLGTGRMFGVFASETVVLDSSGIARSLHRIVEEGTVGDLRFESFLPPCERVNWNIAGMEIWNLFKAASVTQLEGRVALPCGSKKQLAPIQEFGSLVASDTSRHVLLDRDKFFSSLSQRWASTILAAGYSWLYSEVEDKLIVERNYWPFGLWYLSALSSAGKAYSVEYDTLQHSAVAVIVETATAPDPISRGLTAFFSAAKGANVVLAWDDATWHPLVNGFVIPSI